MNEMKINIAKEYSVAPGGRYKKDGRFSGEEFRSSILGPKLKTAIENHTNLEIDLDGTYGYSSSFLDEVFGGLIRDLGFSTAELNTHLVISASSEHAKLYRLLAVRYIEEAAKHKRAS